MKASRARALDGVRATGASTEDAPAAGDAALTPAMRQYAQQKAQVPDAILLFRIGDFYETFYDDAKTISRVLGLTLTARSREKNAVPLAGIPYHALDGYLARLVRAGYKVAISEQTEDARQAKGLVRREVLRVVTPGTLTDEGLLDAQGESVLVAAHPADDGDVGIACVELASGRFWAEMIPAARAVDELARVRPAEMIVAERPIDQPDPLAEAARSVLSATVTPRPADRFDRHHAKALLHDHFGVTTLAGFGLGEQDASVCAAGAVIDYLRETQRAALAHVVRIERRSSDRYVAIDAAALRGLEIDATIREGTREGSLVWAVDRTVSPMGGRRLKEWIRFPLRDVADIRGRQEAITELRRDRMRLTSLRARLRDMADVERITGRLGVGRVTPRDVSAMARSLRLVAAIREMPLDGAGPAREPGARGCGAGRLAGIVAALGEWETLAAYLESALRPDAPATQKDGDYIADGFDAELDRLRGIQRNGSQWLAEFQARESQRTGISSLKVGYNGVFGYFIEITHTHRDRVPQEYVRRQTVKNAERYITDELKRHEDEVLGARDRAAQRESDLFEQVKSRMTADLPALQAMASAVADLDALAGLAEVSLERNYCRPEIIDKASGDGGRDGDGVHGPEEAARGELDIRDGRHPVLDQLLGPRFVPNDAALGGSAGMLAIITGPNMAGKSTYIRQVALLTLLAQTGSYVPAASMRWTPVDRVFARIGASDEIGRGQSTFMVEMVETACILNNATGKSLVVLDEIGRGTSTFDGLALAWAICEQLVRGIGCRTLFATHYHELTELAKLLPGVDNLSVAVREVAGRGAGSGAAGGTEIVFLHKIVAGATDKSYGVHVARMAGIPPEVVRRSQEVLRELERGFEAESRTSAMRPRRANRRALDELTLFPGMRTTEE